MRTSPRLATVEFRENKKTRAGAWSALDEVDDEGLEVRTLYHYSTAMLAWYYRDPAAWTEVLSLGHGSVSDQQGVNKVLQALGVGLYYSRRGGPFGPRAHVTNASGIVVLS